MKKIKFRGISKDTDKFVYGDLVTYYKDSFAIAFKNDEGDLIHVPVEPDSVAQFGGYDVDGNELYEGDIFTDDFGHTHQFVLIPSMIWNATLIGRVVPIPLEFFNESVINARRANKENGDEN